MPFLSDDNLINWHTKGLAWTLILGCLVGVGCGRNPTQNVRSWVRETNIVVVGQIYTYRLKLPSETKGARYFWDANLAIDNVLQGDLPMNTLHVNWDEAEWENIPEYDLGNKGIWFLSLKVRSREEKTYVVLAYLPISYLPEVKKYVSITPPDALVRRLH